LWSPKHSRFFKASSAEVAVKRFLNYLRRYTDERPVLVEVSNIEGKNLILHATAVVEWYKGKLEDSSFSGADGEWWRLKTITQEEHSK
jgi:translation elongation factor EF-1alpha